MVLPGTEKMLRYPTIRGASERGIEVYGRLVIGQDKTYKIGRTEAHRVENLGYRVLKTGASYIYVSC